MPIQFNLSVPEKDIAHLLNSGYRGISYWCPRQPFKYIKPKIVKPVMDAGEKNAKVWVMEDYPLLKGGAVEFFTSDDHTGGKTKCRLSRKTIARGLLLMAKKPYTHHFAAFMQENFDEITGDVFIQLSVFGKIEYE